MISKIAQMVLKEDLRDWFGPSEIRFNKKYTTVTLRDEFGSCYDLTTSLEDFIAQNLNPLFQQQFEFTYEIVAVDRFKLYFTTPQVNVPVVEAEIVDDNDDEDWNDIPFKTDNQKLEELQFERLKQDVETFVAMNSAPALKFLKQTNSVVMAEIEELMRFSFLNGLWANASMKDLPILQRFFNERYNELANTFTKEPL